MTSAQEDATTADSLHFVHLDDRRDRILADQGTGEEAGCGGFKGAPRPKVKPLAPPSGGSRGRRCTRAFIAPASPGLRACTHVSYEHDYGAHTIRRYPTFKQFSRTIRS